MISLNKCKFLLSLPNYKGWALLIVSSYLCGWCLSKIGLPAAWMIGPMVAAIAFALLGRRSQTPIRPPLFLAAQGIVGMVTASSFQPSNIPTLVSHWVSVAIVGFGTLAISILVGLLMSYAAKIERVTSILGSLPGGASGMVAMSASVAADTKLVALMQYIRLIVVVLSAAVGARFLTHSTGEPFGNTGVPIVHAPTSFWHILLTMFIAILGLWGGVKLRLPAGALLGSLILGIVANSLEIVHIQLPPGLAPFSYAVIGIYVGLLFDKASIKQAGMLLPYMLASTFTLVASCAGLGYVLMWVSGSDFITCFLGTSPGGIDSIAMTAIGSGANMSLVVALQTVRMLVIVLVGPTIVRFVSKHSKKMEIYENIGKTPS